MNGTTMQFFHCGLSNGYDTYDLFDLGEFDQKGSVRTKFGTKEQYAAPVAKLHEKGVQVYVDIVLNHKGGGGRDRADQGAAMKHGFRIIEDMCEGLNNWMDEKGFARIGDFIGLEAWFKPLAYALILLREGGYPCAFYPDLYGAHYTDKGKDGSDQEIFLDKSENLEKLPEARNIYAYGEQRDYFDHANCIGWTREGTEEQSGSGCAVLLTNGDEGFKQMEIGKKFAGKVFVDFLGKHPAEVPINEDGGLLSRL